MQSEHTIVKFTFRHATSAHSYLMEEPLADRIQEFFIDERADDVVASYIEVATPPEQRAYKAFTAQTQSMKWLNTLSELGFKIVPTQVERGKDVSFDQPKENALTMAFFHLEAEDLRKKVKPMEAKRVWGVKASC
jgi:hypothetical protein